MAKLTLTDGTIFEGTTEEIFAITERFNGVKAGVPPTKTVKRYAEVGERILVVKADMAEGKYKNGDILTVSEIDVYGMEGSVQVSEHDRHLYSYEYEVIVETEDTPKAKPLEVGDYAVVIGLEGASARHNGNIVELTKQWNMNSARFNVSSIGESGIASCNEENLRKATDAEVAEAKALAEQSAKDAKLTQVFTQVGRKPNEYRKGDIVVVTGESTGEKFYGEIGGKNETYSDNRYYFTQFGRIYRNTDKASDMTPVTFVESRLDRN